MKALRHKIVTYYSNSAACTYVTKLYVTLYYSINKSVLSCAPESDRANSF